MPAESLLDAARSATAEELLEKLRREDYLAKLVESRNESCVSEVAGLAITITGHRPATISVCKAEDLSVDCKNAVFELFEKNMMDMYLKSKTGYHPEEKKEELFDGESRFILLHGTTSTQSTLLGFTCFRFDTEETAQDDEQVEVVYCYEVQVESELRGAGLGRLFMRSLETLARAYSLAKVMLTVFEANMGARKFYKHLNYESDEICPSKYAFGDADEKPDYLIMSRSIRARSGRSKKKKKQKAS